jgi:arylsulfatase A-like enzyme
MTAEPSINRPQPSALWPTILLGVVLVGAKAVHWGWPPLTWPEARWWIRDWAISARSDVLFALGFGVLAQLTLLACTRHVALRRWAFRLVLATGAMLALYAVIAIGVFDFLRSPLTYPLLYLAGGVSDMRSSVGGVGHLGIYAAFVWVPLSYLALAVWLGRWHARRPHRRRAVWMLGGACIIAAYYVGAGWVTTHDWRNRSDALIVRSPHWTFIESTIQVALGRETPAFNHAFPPEDLDDFRPVAHLLPVPYPRPPHNVILLVLESTTAEYMSLYGSPYATSPQLARAAHHSLVYDNFYTPVGLTANVLASINLSIYPFMTWREYTVEHPDYPGRTMADELSARGYRTAFLHTGHLQYTNQDGFLAHRGYDAVLDWDDLGHGEPEVSSWGGDDRMLVDRLLEWIDADRQRPFYAMAWTINSHHPYEPVPGQKVIDFFAGLTEDEHPPDAWDLGRYLNTLRETDHQIGRLLDGLRERGLDDDTLVVVTGDHGEAFGSPHGTWGHGFRLYEENIHVPLVIWNPRLFPTGERRATIGSHVDINPTIAQILGLPPAPTWEGRSLLDPDRAQRAYFYAANDFYLLGVRQGSWKYIYNATLGTEELYDLATDPEEQKNLSEKHPELCRRLRQRLSAWRSFTADQLARASDVRVASE